MTVVTKNLGLVRAIEIGTSEPTNIAVIWYNTNVDENVHYVYDTIGGTWRTLASEVALLLTPGSERVTAYIGGGQLNAFQTTEENVKIITITTDGDSVKTIEAALNTKQHFKNRCGTGRAADIFPSLGDKFEGVDFDINEAYSLADGNDLVMYCYEDGIWTI